MRSLSCLLLGLLLLSPTPARAEGDLTLVHFSARWCGGCQVFAPALSQFEASHGDRFTAVHVDVDEKSSEAYQRYEALWRDGAGWAIPFTVLLDARGKPVAQWVGPVPYERLVEDAGPALGP